MGDLVWLIFKRILSFLERFLISIKTYLLSSMFNIIECATQILILICFIYWININNVQNPGQYEVSKIINSTDKSLFGKMESQAVNFENYRQLQSFAIFGLMLVTLKYVYFSKRMSKFLDFFHQAKFDFIFYIMVFSIALIAFSVWPSSLLELIYKNTTLSTKLWLNVFFYYWETLIYNRWLMLILLLDRFFTLPSMLLFLILKIKFLLDFYEFDINTNVYCHFGWTLHRLWKRKLH